jgi:hypothetical protein
MGILNSVAMLLVWAVLILATGCSGGNRKTDPGDMPVGASLDSSFLLGFDKMAIVKSEKLSIRFTNVPEDSRCPVGVHCVWAGQVRIDLEIQKGSRTAENIQLISLEGQPELGEKKFDKHLIRLIKVEPPRTTGRELELSDYKITLSVSEER